MLGFGDATARRREKARRKARGALGDYYATPLPDAATPASELPCLSVDFETTGLDPARDTLLSVGFVRVDGPTLTFAGAGSMLVRGAAEVGQSAVVHGLTDDMVAQGVPLEEAAEALLSALAGRVLIAHYADIEVGFLSRACEQLYGAPFVTPVIDTMRIMFTKLSMGFDAEPPRDALRLWNARARYHLPVYTAHEALTDAIAGAELYLAQVAEMTGDPTLRSLRTD
ncbi:exonuclease domain-containing protein [Nigerium massiliense]|uniref:exonuclease domain-containing protein n=1 Tax=Nigerium massiliense TaxID=1522317 RepID=UPI0006941E27|nr:exonuclease domain-containing protein [Nigerium massiliense]